MKPTSASLGFLSAWFRFWLTLRRLLPKQACRTFGGAGNGKRRDRIEKVYVINLDREPGRWSRMERELRLILDSSGVELLALTQRLAAVDAKTFLEEPSKDSDIDPFYTLADQLFVEPQPLVFPSKVELNTPIRMSRAEVAVARSHISAWRELAASSHAYALVLEDDVWFHTAFAQCLDQAWRDVISDPDKSSFDLLYVSYLEARHGAPKAFVSSTLFRPVRGLWYLSGYVLSRDGAEKLLRLLPCRGPVDLWLNHQFERLNVLATKRPLVSQRLDVTSTNSYSILPTLTTIGAITSEGASLFNIRPIEHPVFAFGPDNSGHSALAVALCMLGYRSCSDLQLLPAPELERLLSGSSERVFDAYVNVGSLQAHLSDLRSRYPRAKFILTTIDGIGADAESVDPANDLHGADVAILPSDSSSKWQIVCEHLRSAPPSCRFPRLKDLGQRPVGKATTEGRPLPESKWPKRDRSPWIVEPRAWWHGIHLAPTHHGRPDVGAVVRFDDYFDSVDADRWLLRSDTFTDNLALFRPSNVELSPGAGAALHVRREALGVRAYSAAAISSRDEYLFGRFEATIQAANVPGVVTGLFLHRNSPRQEIDVEITGDRPDRLVVNVFYNPGDEGAKFDYGFRGAPSYIDLGFDASEASHRFAIEWKPNDMLWWVDDRLVHRRATWDPTPIPHLPMTLHINTWPTRSTELAGRINERRLPATTLLRSVVVEATSGRKGSD